MFNFEIHSTDQSRTLNLWFNGALNVYIFFIPIELHMNASTIVITSSDYLFKTIRYSNQKQKWISNSESIGFLNWGFPKSVFHFTIALVLSAGCNILQYRKHLPTFHGNDSKSPLRLIALISIRMILFDKCTFSK